MLNIQHLTKKYDNNVAVSDVSFTIAPGEIYSLIGPNSSGKTTIVRSIVGLLATDGGSITVDGSDVANAPMKTKAIIGYIPDEPSIWSGMTGEEFLHFTGTLYGMQPHERVEKIAALLPVFALTDIKDEYFENYSRGNKQKFSILAALLHSPKLLLIDEPIVGLDPESATAAKSLFTKFAQGGGAVLLVTHTLPVAEEISTRVGVMKEGKLLREGTVSELRAEAKLSAKESLETVYAALTKQS